MLVSRQIIRDIINEMVKDVIINTKKNIKKEKIKNINDVYRSNTNLICFSNEMNNFDISIKFFLRERMYFNKKVLNKTKEGSNIIKSLFKSILKKPNKFIKKSNLKHFSKQRVICDFIAGMTDRYAINIYKNTK